MIIEPADLQAKSNQMNSVDLVTPLTSRITKVDYNPRQEQPISIFLEGYEKRPYKPCKSMLRGICKAWGNDTDTWAGNLISIYCDPTVKWAGEATGGIRISGISGIDKPFEFTVQLNKKQRKIETWDVIPDEQEVVKEFIFTHHESDINEAKSDEAITEILKAVRAEFGDERMAELKDVAIAARAKLAGVES